MLLFFILLVVDIIVVFVVYIRSKGIRFVCPKLPSNKVSGLATTTSWSLRQAASRRKSTTHGETWEIKFHELELKRKLASGSFGSVFLAVWMKGTRVAVKIPSDDVSEDAMIDFLEEVRNQR